IWVTDGCPIKQDASGYCIAGKLGRSRPSWPRPRYGTTVANSIQVQRRLRAMLKDLIETVPAPRTAILQKELTLLASSSKRTFFDLDDQTLAETGDLQGIGGSYDDMDN
ncbi:MAG TPA: hypothetical protein VFS77_01640, partial [Pyrinomonadaceae bacterium]|nr:hypothetical protein [Pyrinomonadaceae bacterium]